MGHRKPFRIAAAGAMALSLLLPGTLDAAETAKCQVSSLKYTNNGAYGVKRITLMWIDGDGVKQSHNFRPPPHKDYVALNGESWSYNLYNDPDGLGIGTGNEVWIKISINLGDEKNCRKDGHKLTYHRAGSQMPFKSGGTTLNNNRCKFDGKIENLCTRIYSN